MKKPYTNPPTMIRAMFLLLLAQFFLGCSSISRTTNLDPHLRIIDAHIHTEFDGTKEPASLIMMSQDELFRQMREAGVTGAIAHTSKTGGNYYDLKSKNIFHCGGVEATPDVKRLEQGLKSNEYICLKIYLGYVHQYATDAKYKTVYALAKKYDVPVVFHTGDTYDSKGKLKFADPLVVDEIAVDNPDVKFVIAHLGNPWIQSAAEVIYKNPNVYGEASGLMLGDVSELPPEQLKRFVIEQIEWAFQYVEDPKKIMFGTDWPLVEIKPYVDAYKKAIPVKHWQDVFHDNACRVFSKMNCLKTSEELKK